MKRGMAFALALGCGVGGAAGARAEGLDCCQPTAAKTSACCSTSSGAVKICLDVSEVSAADLVSRLGEALGAEVRIQGPSYGTFTVKLCAPSAEAALKEVAAAMHARWRRAFVFGDGPAAASTTSNRHLTVDFKNTATSTAAFIAAAQAGGVIITDRPLKGRVTFSGKNVPVGAVMDAIAQTSGLTWKAGYVLQVGPDTVAMRRNNASQGVGSRPTLTPRAGSPLNHLHRGPGGVETVAPAPGMIVKDPEAELARLAEEAFRRQQLGEWANVFTQESPKAVKKAIRDLRIRVETTIQKLESYPPQNRHLGAAMWRARYERMLEDYKVLTPEQQKQVQPVLDAMKYFAAPGS